MKNKRAPESGSIIFWIFVTIALFAALSFAVANMMRGGSTDVGEIARLRATDIMQYAGAVQRGVRAMSVNGVDESEICFHATQWGHANYEYNPQCADDANRVFSPNGGGINFQDSVSDWYGSSVTPANGDRTWVFSSRFEVGDVGTDSGGAATVAASADLIMATAPVLGDVCRQINALLGHSDPTPPAVAASTYDDLATTLFAGGYADDATGRIGALGRERCVSDPGGFNMYYKVILAR